LRYPTARRPDVKASVRVNWVPEYEGLYAVSDDGRVFSYHKGSPRQLSPGTRTGYEFVVLQKDKTTSFRTVHRLVYESFSGPINGDNHVHHINGDRSNNRLSDLEQQVPEEHGRSHGYAQGQKMARMVCPVCESEFIRRRNNTHLVKPNNATYCSRSCAARSRGISEDLQTEVLEVYTQFNAG